MPASRPLHHLLLCLGLPGNVERKLADLRMQIFKETGACSSQALPPVIPLCYLRSSCEAEVVELLPQEQIPPIEIGKVAHKHGTVVISTHLAPAWKRWLANLECRDAPHEMPVPLAGIFLAATDARDSTDRTTVAPEAALPHHLAVAKVELIAVSVSDDPWWMSVDWEVMWSKRIKLRG